MATAMKAMQPMPDDQVEDAQIEGEGAAENETGEGPEVCVRVQADGACVVYIEGEEPGQPVAGMPKILALVGAKIKALQARTADDQIGAGFASEMTSM